MVYRALIGSSQDAVVFILGNKTEGVLGHRLWPNPLPCFLPQLCYALFSRRVAHFLKNNSSTQWEIIEVWKQLHLHWSMASGHNWNSLTQKFSGQVWVGFDLCLGSPRDPPFLLLHWTGGWEQKRGKLEKLRWLATASHPFGNSAEFRAYYFPFRYNQNCIMLLFS